MSGIILAAGGSRRMGKPKQLLDYFGRPLLSFAIEAARRSCLTEVVVVLGGHAREISDALSLDDTPGIRVVTNDDWASGQASSLRFGLSQASAGTVAAAILLGDQPGVTAETIDLVVARFASLDVSRTPILRPVYTGGGDSVPGHPVIISRSVWPQVSALEGDRGARALIEAQSDKLATLSLDAVPPADIDTPADYHRALVGSGGPPRRRG